jgi:hypothetical protein
MEARMLTLYNDKAPVSGTAMYFVVEIQQKMAWLYHWPTRTYFNVPIHDYREGAGHELWPENTFGGKFIKEDVAQLLLLDMRKAIREGKSINQHVVRSIIAALRDCELTEVPSVREMPRAANKPQVKSAKRPGVIDEIIAKLSEGATVDEMVLHLKGCFPDRAETGMRTTVRCQINRLPAKLGRKITKLEDGKRGTVLKFA